MRIAADIYFNQIIDKEHLEMVNILRNCLLADNNLEEVIKRDKAVYKCNGRAIMYLTYSQTQVSLGFLNGSYMHVEPGEFSENDNSKIRIINYSKPEEIDENKVMMLIRLSILPKGPK